METSVEHLVVSSSPHLKSSFNIETAMRDVIIGLCPALFMAVYFFRLPAVAVIATSVAAAVLSEGLCQKIRGREISVKDGSAVVTGLLLAFCLPSNTPLWIVAAGAAGGIILGKQFFGGLGHNVFNPALVGRAIVLVSWPAATSVFIRPVDGVSSATPLAVMKEIAKLGPGASGAVQELAGRLPSLWDMFVGNIAGSLGETSALAIIIGGLYLLYKRDIDWRIPGTYLGTVFVLTGIFGFITGKGTFLYPIYHLLGGGLMLGAFFMATDWVTSPITKRGRILFGLGCGILTVVIRLKGGYPEGVCYSILLMNCCTPLIDRFTKPRVYGRRKNA